MQLRILGIVSLVIVAMLAALSASPNSGKADSPQGFHCGSGFLTYTVKVQPGSTGGGVRCVKFIDYELVNGQMTGVYWYGEGTLNEYVYRHLGNVYQRKDPTTGTTTIVSLASDIYGNGENAKFTASDLKLTPIHGQDLIQETSEWPEQWILEPSGVANYTSHLKRVRNCGRFFTKFVINNGSGVRCSMRSGRGDEYPHLVWYGDETSGSVSERHLGIVTGRDEKRARATAIDFCGKSRCMTPNSYELFLTGLNHCNELYKIRVTGGWNELWTSSEQRTCFLSKPAEK